MGEGFNVVNAKLGFMVEKELEARAKVDQKLKDEVHETSIDYDKYIKRKYSF